MTRVDDEQLWSWVDRNAAELEGYLREHPEDRGRVDELRRAIGALDESATRLPLPGEIAGYRIVGRLGAGSMGTVFVAEQPAPRREVALKVIHGGPLATTRRAWLFEREAQALARLTHPGIAAIYEAGRTSEGDPFLVMELVRGVSLDTYLREQSPSREQRLALFGRLCDAMSHAHGQGVVHRDLKPSNILVDPSGQPKIVDFGLARLAGEGGPAGAEAERTRPGDLMGTLHYMSPEQARGDVEQVTARSDVYALGVILYQMLLDRLPYEIDERDLTRALRAICDEPPRPFDRKVARDLETIVLRALAKEPRQRYADAGELGADVRRFVAGEPVLARRPGLLYRGRLWARRHRAAVVAAAAVVLVAAAAWGWPRSGGDPADFLRGLEGQGFAKLSPFEAVRWKGREPLVLVDGTWWELTEIAGHPASTVVRYCEVTAEHSFWTKRFEEDLVEVLTRIANGRDPGTEVELVLRDPEDGSTSRRRVAMTAEKRAAVWRTHVRSPFTAVRWRDSVPEVDVDGDGRWMRVVSIEGARLSDLLAYCARRGRSDWRFRFETALEHVLMDLEHPPGATVRLTLENVETGEVVEREGVANTYDKLMQLRVPWTRDDESYERLGLASAPRLAPFTSIEWRGDRAEVTVEERTFDLLAVNGIALEDLVSFCVDAFPKTWRQRLGEDLVAILAAMSATSVGGPRSADLELRDAAGRVVELRDVPMTEENREILRFTRHREDRP